MFYYILKLETKGYNVTEFFFDDYIEMMVFVKNAIEHSSVEIKAEISVKSKGE